MKKLTLCCLVLLFPLNLNAFEIQQGVSSPSHRIRCSAPLKKSAKRIPWEVRIFKKRYNDWVLNKILKKIVFCGKLVRGPYAWMRGTYVEGNVATLWVEIDKKDDTQAILHHEMSSILLHSLPRHTKYRFKQKWKQYSNRGYNIDHDNHGYVVKPLLQRDGFLYDYCLTSFENDFNFIASFHLTSWLKRKLVKASKTHYRIKSKYDLMLTLYKDQKWIPKKRKKHFWE
tara:strand:+ start:8558 stop:9241 length:684 start_codon:yes stop_codon:yes gene_type:complete